MTSLNQLGSLRGRLALITGAAGYLGQTIAETLVEMGADLILTDIDKEGLCRLKKKLDSYEMSKIKCIEANLEEEASRSYLIDQVNAAGDIDILINNAAFVGTTSLDGWSVKFQEQSIPTWRRALEVNLTAVFHLSRDLSLPLGRTKGCIVNISSIYGSYGPDWSLYEGLNMGNAAAYSASKAAIVQLTKYLSTTLAPSVRANSISPGGIYRGQNPEFVSRYCSKTPLGRMANEDDFKGIIAYLASDLSCYVTGQNIAVDGGWGVW